MARPARLRLYSALVSDKSIEIGRMLLDINAGNFEAAKDTSKKKTNFICCCHQEGELKTKKKKKPPPTPPLFTKKHPHPCCCLPAAKKAHDQMLPSELQVLVGASAFMDFFFFLSPFPSPQNTPSWDFVLRSEAFEAISDLLNLLLK